MTLNNVKVTIVTVYAAAIGIAGIISGTTAAASWITLIALTVLPAVALVMMWHEPLQTMSERIQAARR